MKRLQWWLYGAAFMVVTAVAEHQWWWLAGAAAMVAAGAVRSAWPERGRHRVSNRPGSASRLQGWLDR